MSSPLCEDRLVGSRLGHYEITRHLGGGGMGEVYAARDTRLNREVAIKVLPEQLAQRDDRRTRFEREAKAIASLSHPNIVTLHAVEEADGRSFIVMELVRGRTLGEIIPSGGMDLEEFFRTALPLADAIHAAHLRGISHRDLKPTNVMVGDDGRVKVLDFGLAKVMEVDTDPDGITRASSGLTAEGRILGTVAYMSPEQAEGKSLDHRSDVFSLGILLYEMLTGRRPFVGDSNIAVLSSILRDPAPPLREGRQGLPLELERIVARALEKPAESRYQSAAELRRDLEDLRRDMNTGEILAAASDDTRRGRPTGPAWQRPGPRALGLGLLAILVAGLAAWLLLPSGESRAPATSARGSSGGAATVTTPIATETRPGIAVFYFANLDGDPELDWLRSGLTDMLVTQLSQSPDLRVLGTDRLYQLMEDHGVLDATTIPFDAVQAIGTEAGVNRSVVGSFLREGERLRISARVQDIADGRVIRSETVEGDADASILDLVDTLAARIRETFEAQATAAGDDMVAAADPTPTPPRDLREVTSGDLDAWRQFSRGLRIEKEDGAEAAIPAFEAALEADPGFALALSKLSRLHDTLGNEVLAAEFATRAMERSDRLPEPNRLFLEGRMQLFDPQEVEIADLEKTAERFPDMPESVDLQTEIAGARLAREQTGEAIAQLEEIWSRSTDLKTAQMLAEAQAANGNVARGMRVLGEYVARRPADPAGHARLAEFTLRWNPAAAGEAISEATRRGMGAGAADSLRWTAEVMADDWTEAGRIARGLLESDDPARRWEGAHRLALLALLRGDGEGAADLLDDAWRATPAGTPLRAQAAATAASTLLQIPAPERAATLATAALTEGPDGHLALELVAAAAVAARLVGDPDGAEEHVARFSRLLPGIPMPDGLREREMLLLRGRLAFADGDFAAAADQIGIALRSRRDPRSRDLWDAWLLARALWENGERESARGWLQRIIGSGPIRADEPVAFVRAIYLLGLDHELRGEYEEAAGYYRRFLSYRQGGSMDDELVEHATNALSGLQN